MRRAPVLTALLLLISFTSVLRAQSTNASLTGRVTDPQKALIVDAKVAAISAGTNIRYETTTNGSGEYYLTNLSPNAYHIEIEKSGFKKLVKPDLILHVQDALKIDFEMTLGDVSETVTVEAGMPLVNSASGVVSTVIDRRFVENLPLNGRSFQTLIMLTPGVVVTATRFDDQGQFSIKVPRSNVFVRSRVWAHPRRTGFDRDALRNQSSSRHGVRVFQEQRSGCERLVCERQQPSEASAAPE